MNGRSIARAAAAVTSLGIGAVLALTGTAVAEPTVDTGLEQLTTDAGSDPGAQAGVGALSQFTKMVDIAELRNVSAAFTPFAYAAPTFGCGSIGPVTTIIAAASTDGSNPNGAADPLPGTLRFSATPAHSGAPISSGLVVAWLNVNTGASGLTTLDDRTEYNMPTLSKTVTSGPGTVIASMWGMIDYPFAHCVMTPTVGMFYVPDLPVLPPAPESAAPAPAQPASTQDPVAPAAPNHADSVSRDEIAHQNN
ncbi:hypothetical protein OG563_11090 [Nocardia vinacea]|uniref:Uncharacterized protein n=1 Tax=Nocardia vinacea TaxID=96468 RepID=A0ABZ1Z3N1_9NOCA|nr:hypothetical protein [Nocardia vinacea]